MKVTKYINNGTPVLVQSVDKWIDREYYKISEGFLFHREHRVMADRIAEWVQWDILCQTMPDKLLINGEPYELKKITKKSKRYDTRNNTNTK